MFSLKQHFRRVLSNVGSQQPRKRKGNRRRLVVESLENRNLLFGDVTALVSGGTLFIDGDVDDNWIEIDQDGLAADEFRVSGALVPGGVFTTVNGVSSQVFSGVTRDIRMTMGDGNDWVRIIDSDVPRNVRFDGGDGTNTLSIEAGSVVGRHVLVSNGDGLDNFLLDASTVNRNVWINNGDGDSLTELTAGSEVAGNLNVTNDEGFDQLTITAATVDGRVRVDNGDGGDLGGTVFGSFTEINTGSIIGGSLKVHNADGIDFLYADDSNVGGNLRIHNGDGGSDTSLAGMVIGGNLSVRNGAGDDDFSLQNSEVFGNVRIVQGTGAGSATIGANAPTGMSVIHGKFNYVGGDGVDEVSFNHAVIFGHTRISTGAGDDLIEVFNSLFVRRVRVNGGSGTDTFDDDPSVFFLGGKSLVSIEVIS